MPRQRPPEQLDIPLVWEIEEAPVPPGGIDGLLPATEPARPCDFGRLVLAGLADLGATLVAVALGVMVAVTHGAALDAGQLALAGMAGVELAAVVAVGCLWGWRGTPGLLLVRAGTGQPLSLGRAVAFCLVWLTMLPLAGLPLLIGRRGRRLAERLAGSAFNCR